MYRSASVAGKCDVYTLYSVGARTEPVANRCLAYWGDPSNHHLSLEKGFTCKVVLGDHY